MNNGINKKMGIWGVTLLISFLYAQHENWVYRFNGPANTSDICYSVVYGSDGKIYGGGVATNPSPYYTDWCILSLNPDGTQPWMYFPSGWENAECNNIVYGSDNNIYGVGWFWDYPGFGILSLTNLGSYRWEYLTGLGEGYGIIYGRDNNIYACGYVWGEDWWPDFAVVSVTTSGAERWVYIYTLAGSEYDHAYSLTQDEDYNIYAAGQIQNKFTVISLTNTGAVRWIYTHQTSSCANSIVYGNDGNIYVAGNGVILCLNRNTGQKTWEYTFGSNLYSLIYGGDGNLYMCSGNTILSLKNTGEYRWAYSLSGASFSNICYGIDGNIYACGGISNNILLIKINSNNGQLMWQYTYEGPGNGNDYAYSICCDASGNIYIGGFSTGIGTQADFTIISVKDLYLGEYEVLPRQDDAKDKNNFHISTSNFFNDKIHLKLNGFYDKELIISLYDVTGKKLFSQKFIPNKSITISDKRILNLSKGVYLLVINSEQKEIDKIKLIKR